MKQCNKYLCPTLTLIAAISVFAFFEVLFPYTLRHKEQTIFLLLDKTWIDMHYHEPGLQKWLAVAGDYIQQFFFYACVGAMLMSVLVTLIGIVLYKAIRQMKAARWIAMPIAATVMVWECCRICGEEYPIGSTLQLLLWAMALWAFVKSLKKWKNPESNHDKTRQMAESVTLLVMMVACLVVGGFSLLPKAKWWNIPRRNIERLYAIDSNAYYGDWKTVESLSATMLDYPIAQYYHNLAKACQGRLAERLMEQPMRGTSRLFLPVDQNGNHVQFTAANEVWWMVGDMTTAEHAAILGMIFSPRHAGSRNIRRLAQIAMRRGDQEGAMKYLRLLDKSPVHSRWAKKQMQTELSPYTLHDTLSLTGEHSATLRNLLDHNHKNTVARDYLLCYDLLSHNLQAFTDDALRYGCPNGQRLYEEAMLVVMQINPEMREKWQPMVAESTYRDFVRFNQTFEQSKGNGKMMYNEFHNTYWYYLQFHDQTKN